MNLADAWIQTFTGRKARPFNLKAEQVCIEDVAHALSHICRFGGHCITFYSVAEHSVRLSHLVPAADALAGLLHDAFEAYIGDVTQPVKQHTFFQHAALSNLVPFSIREIERDGNEAIFRALGVAMTLPASVKQADLFMLCWEARDLLGPSPEPWHHEEIEVSQAPALEPWSSAKAKHLFIERYNELTETK